jgi:alkylglycerol monooxygenase
MPNPIALAVPFFFLLMGVELLIAHRKGKKLYRFADVLSCLGCGMTQQVLLVFEAAALTFGYVFLYQHRLTTLSTPWSWVVAFFYVDLVYYVWHRLSHRINVLWAVHAVHHQSEDYNLAVALRQAVLSVWTIWPLHLPLALLGVPPAVFLIVSALSTLYQFWIHTELVGKLGWFERVFNTPAQHRVHHAVNPRYLDKNYAATLCIWDRVFGTFEEEEEEPVYGLVKPLGTFDPLHAQLFHFGDLWRRSRTGGARVWFEGPESGFGPAPEATRALQRKHAVPLSKGQIAWLSLNLAVATAGTTALMWNAAAWPFAMKAALAAFLLLTIAGFGAVLEGRRWLTAVEVCRAAVLACGLLLF